MQHLERRATMRTPWSRIASIYYQNRRSTAWTKDMSAGGLLLSGDAPASLGEAVQVRIPIGLASHTTLWGIVIRAQIGVAAPVWAVEFATPLDGFPMDAGSGPHPLLVTDDDRWDAEGRFVAHFPLEVIRLLIAADELVTEVFIDPLLQSEDPLALQDFLRQEFPQVRVETFDFETEEGPTCASCGESILWPEDDEPSFCRSCLERSTQTFLDPDYDDLGNPG